MWVLEWSSVYDWEEEEKQAERQKGQPRARRRVGETWCLSWKPSEEDPSRKRER